MLSKGVGPGEEKKAKRRRKNPLMNGAWQPGKPGPDEDEDEDEDEEGDNEGEENEGYEHETDEDEMDERRERKKPRGGLHLLIEFGPGGKAKR